MADEINTTSPSEHNNSTPLEPKYRQRLWVAVSDIEGEFRRLEARIEALLCLSEAVGRGQAMAVRRLDDEMGFYKLKITHLQENAVAALNEEEPQERNIMWDLD